MDNPYTGPTQPSERDTELVLLRKICASLSGLFGGGNGGTPAAPFPAPYTASTVANVTATGTTGAALAANPDRKNAVIVNYGATNGVFLGIGRPAESGKGIYLAPNGGSYEINASNLTHLAINVITATSTTTLSIHEGT